MKNPGRTQLIVAASVFLLLFGNIRFFTNVLGVYPLTPENGLPLLSLVVVFGCINVILLSLLCVGRATKPVLITILLVSSLAAYFMDTYNVIIDDTMIQNLFKTDLHEAADLVSASQVLYFVVLGLLPAVLVYRLRLPSVPLRKAVVQRLVLIGVAFTLMLGSMAALGGFYASFIREHKPLRFYSNPSYYLYSTVGYLNGLYASTTAQKLQPIGVDARIPASDMHRELVILVVGETARADHFSLNGYARKTNPLLEQEHVISFTNVWSCGTSTAVSVPCMFSIYGRAEYDAATAGATENLLDVLQRSGVNVIWLDNNSDSKGVATRTPYVSYKTQEINPNCDSECRDEGMLANLQDYIDTHPQGDIFIVLHQMGNHGPAYHKRYPPAFKVFQPVCETNQLEDCSSEQITNSYDNAILYTDYFLAKTIELLKRNSAGFEAAMFYISDHGESLGEGGVYLHGLPYMLAPEAQTHVPMIMWFSESFDKLEIDMISLKENSRQRYSHDNLFHTLLGLMEVETEVYDETLDLIRHGRDE